MAGLELEYPHDSLLEVANSPYRFKVVCAGRRCGKTSLSKYLMAKCLLKDSGKVTYVSPTYTMADEVWNFFYSGFKNIADTVSTQKKIIRLKNGGFFRVLSSDNIGDGFRGFSNDLIVIDEAAMIPGLSEMFFLSALPTLSDRIGKALFISTPRGNNDFYEIWKMGDPERKGYEEYAQYKDFYSWKFKTADNPFILQEEINNAKATMPERFFAQEYLGDFLLDGSGFFRYIERVSILFEMEPYRGNFVFGIDFGKKHDYTVVVVIDVDTNNEVCYYRFNKIEWAWQREEIIRYNEMWKPISILAEENSFGDANIEILEELGLPIEKFYTTNKSKKKIIENLSVDIENQDIALLRDKMQIEELQIYQLNISENGNYKFGAPAGKNDDIVMALALANEARRNTTSFKAFALPKM